MLNNKVTSEAYTGLSSDTLNKVASLLGTEDKNIVLSYCVKTLVDGGIPMEDAFNKVLGEGRYQWLVSTVYGQLRKDAGLEG